MPEKNFSVETAASPQINASVSVNLLNTSLNAIYEHGLTEDNATYTRMLVMPSNDVSGNMTLEEITNAINAMIKDITKIDGEFKAENLQPILKQFGLEGLSKLKICLKQVFFYSNSTTKAGQNQSEPESSIEYALCIEIDEPLHPKSPELQKLFSVEKLSFAVWYTNRKKILDKMQLGSIDSLLS